MSVQELWEAIGKKKKSQGNRNKAGDYILVEIGDYRIQSWRN